MASDLETLDMRLLKNLWKQLQLPESALSAITIKDSVALSHYSAFQLPSSFRVNDLAVASIGLFHLAAAQYHALSTGTRVPPVKITRLGAAIEFKSETHFTVNGKPLILPQSWGGLHATRDGHVRIHDGFEVHREGVRQILGLKKDAGKKEVAAACLQRSAFELEDAAFKDHAVIGALRSFDEWDNTLVGRSVPDFPISIRSLNQSTVDHASTDPPLPRANNTDASRCLAGVRVIEVSRVIAAPVAGRALASHGADVLWVTSPNLEDQPYLDQDMARGKRTTRLDLDSPKDLQTLKDLIRDADVFIQGYRPGSLAKRGLGPDDLQKLNPRIIYASMSAYPQLAGNPWRYNRGFDSIVQTCSGINAAEAVSFNALCSPDEPVAAKPLPCQALDHGSGFLLAAGIVTALSRRSERGPGQLVEVSLAGTSRLLRSLPRFQDKDCFEGKRNTRRISEVIDIYGEAAEALFDEADSEFGRMKFVKPAGQVEGMRVGWDRMPRPLGLDSPHWLDQE